MNSIESIYRVVFNAVLSGSIVEIAEAAYNILHCPVIITDSSYVKLTEVYPSEIQHDPKWDEYIDVPELSVDAIKHYLNSDYIDKMQVPHQPLLMNRGYFQNSPRLTCAVTDKGHLLGYISAYVKNKAITKETGRSIVVIADAVAMYLRNESGVISGESSAGEIFARDLLMGGGVQTATIRKWESLLGIRLKPEYRVLYMSHAPESGTNLNYFNNYLKTKIRNLSKNILTYQSGNTLYVLLYGIDKSQDFHTITDEIESLVNEFQYECGISDLCDDIKDLPRCRKQAETAFDIGRKWLPDKSLYFYDDLMLEAMLESSTTQLGIENCIDPAVIDLFIRDEESHSEYLQTLRTFISCSCKPTETCNELHVHRNTLNYRLHKIQEMTGADLSDAMTRIRLAISIMVMDYWNIRPEIPDVINA
ncbi:MAG: PucR family transcriptional regulator [Anaerovoracaceae bacterium]|jgi:hypothetical protein